MEHSEVDLEVRFTALVEPCSRRLWTFVLRLVGERARAEDLYQETLLRAWRALPSYRERGKSVSWLFRIAHNVVRDDSRRQAARPVLLSPLELPERPDHQRADDRVMSNERSRRLSVRMKLLSDPQREVFLLRMHSGLTFREIAKLTGAPLSTVINRMRDALGKLVDLTEGD